MTGAPSHARKATLRSRLAATFAAITTVTVVTVVVVVHLMVGRSLLAAVDETLDDQLLTVLDEVAGETETSEIVEELSELRLPAGRGIQVVTAGGRVVAARGDDPSISRLTTAQAAAVTSGDRARGTLEDATGDRRLVAAASEGTVVVLTEPLADVQQARRTVLGVLVPVGLVAVLVAGMVGWWAAGRGLAPLRHIALAAERVDARKLDTRVPDPRTDDELGALAGTLNRMLDRLDETFERERRFTADASHELRTPLAILRGEVELAHGRTTGRTAERLASALEEADRLAALVDDLLLLARADGDTAPSLDRVDLRELADAAVSRFEVLAAASAVRLVRSGAATVTGDRAALERAVTNLIDNAVRHTPADGAITVAVHGPREGLPAEIVVTDDGPGVPEALQAALFDRFARPDGGRTGGGAGLGLAIVAAVARAHGGHAWARTSAAGGLEVHLTVADPPADAARPLS